MVAYNGQLSRCATNESSMLLHNRLHNQDGEAMFMFDSIRFAALLLSDTLTDTAAC